MGRSRKKATLGLALFWLLSLTSAALAAIVAAPGCYPQYDEGTRVTDAGAVDSATGTGLPCEVQALLEDHCQSCHSKTPTAPMSLMTYADLVARDKSVSGKTVAEVAVMRMSDPQAPMPPSALLVATDQATLAGWVDAGTPWTTCIATPLFDAGNPSAPACARTSDCPAPLVCAEGACVAPKEPPTRDAGVTLDAGSDAGGVAYTSFTDTSQWTMVTVPSLSTQTGYSGATFDGRYMYFAPDGASGVITRFDTLQDFSASLAWDTHNLVPVNANAHGFRGALFDGRYVYFVPNEQGAIFARFDTSGAMSDPTMWTLMDLHAISPDVGFMGGTFDGRYVYLAPWSSGTTLRYDTKSPFASTSSWASFDTATVDASAHAYAGAVFDGRYTYFVPAWDANGPRSVVARYDTTGAFTSAASWSTLDLTTLSAGAAGYRTGAFDGRYLYLIPGWSTPSPSWSSSTLARLDTKGAFAAPSSWTFMDLAATITGATGYNAATFDGRYLFFAPGYNARAAVHHGLTLRLDTQGALTARSSWAVMDTMGISSSLVNPVGSAFDGKYIYFAPHAAVALRYDTRTSAPVPASFPAVGGSFY